MFLICILFYQEFNFLLGLLSVSVIYCQFLVNILFSYRSHHLFLMYKICKNSLDWWHHWLYQMLLIFCPIFHYLLILFTTIVFGAVLFKWLFHVVVSIKFFSLWFHPLLIGLGHLNQWYKYPYKCSVENISFKSLIYLKFILVLISDIELFCKS